MEQRKDTGNDTRLSRRALLKKAPAAAAALLLAPAAVSAAECAEATVKGRAKGQELRERFKITPEHPRCHRVAVFLHYAHLRGVAFVPAQVSAPCAFVGHQNRGICVPEGWDTARRAEAYVRLGAMALYDMGSRECYTDNPVGRLELLWRKRQAYGAAFVRAYLG
jgi:hypothetical protein